MRAEFKTLWDMFFKHIPLEAFQQATHARAQVLEYGAISVNKSRSQENNSRNLFSGLIADSEKADGSLTEEEVCIEAANLIIAGSDTTAVTLTYLIWAVLKKPKLQKELENEVRGLSPDFTATDLEALPLLNATIEETLRLYTAAPGSLPRMTPPNGVNLGGYFLPGNTTVCTQAYSIHRDPDLYSNPLE